MLIANYKNSASIGYVLAFCLTVLKVCFAPHNHKLCGERYLGNMFACVYMLMNNCHDSDNLDTGILRPGS